MKRALTCLLFCLALLGLGACANDPLPLAACSAADPLGGGGTICSERYSEDVRIGCESEPTPMLIDRCPDGEQARCEAADGSGVLLHYGASEAVLATWQANCEGGTPPGIWSAD